MLDGCQAGLHCRKVAIKRMQAGEIVNDVVEVEIDAKLCAYCAADLEENYRDANPGGFVREVPT